MIQLGNCKLHSAFGKLSKRSQSYHIQYQSWLPTLDPPLDSSLNYIRQILQLNLSLEMREWIIACFGRVPDIASVVDPKQIKLKVCFDLHPLCWWCICSHSLQRGLIDLPWIEGLYTVRIPHSNYNDMIIGILHRYRDIDLVLYGWRHEWVSREAERAKLHAMSRCGSYCAEGRALRRSLGTWFVDKILPGASTAESLTISVSIARGICLPPTSGIVYKRRILAVKHVWEDNLLVGLIVEVLIIWSH